MNKRIYWLINVMALLVCSANVARALDLTFSKNYNVGTSPIAVAMGDFNQDGYMDMVVVNYGSANVTVLLNDGTGHFVAAPPYSVDADPHSVAVGDFNGDGYPDLAVANISGNVSILLNDKTGKFSAPRTDYPAGPMPYYVAVGDFNNDGIPDLAVANEETGISILLGLGLGKFGAAQSFTLTGALPTSVAVGDFNGDQFQDLAIADATGNVYRSLNTGSTTQPFKKFTKIVNAEGLPRPYAIVTAILRESSANLDLVVTDYSSNVYVLLGNGDGTFKKADMYAVGDVPTSVAVGDFNGDLKKDLVVANAFDATLTVWHGIGNGKFDTSETIPVGGLDGSIAAADFTHQFSNAIPEDVAAPSFFSSLVTVLDGAATPTCLFCINAGGPAYGSGSWKADEDSTGGTPFGPTASAIAGTTDQEVYQTCRYGNFSYTFPVTNGAHTVILKFAEIFFTMPGQRVFDVKINGVTVLKSFDILTHVGPNTALDLEFPVTVSTGDITIQFVSDTNFALVSGLQIY